MTRTIFAAVAILAAFSGSAFASYAPIKYAKSRAILRPPARCSASAAKSWGLDELHAGSYGCRDTENGNTVSCDENGQCKDYSGDHRWEEDPDPAA